MDKLPISLSMIVKNEEKYLPACLDSVKNLVNEMVILDTGSNDRTVEIAKEYGAKVYHYTWKDDFSDARNTALSYSTNPWILSLDADEELMPETAQWFYDNYPWTAHDGYYVTIHNLRNENIENDYTLDHKLNRFFKNHSENTFKFRIHENIYIGSGTTGDSKVEILHKGYASEERNAQKAVRNIDVLKKKLEANPHDPFTHYYIAQTHDFNKDHEQAIREATKALELGAIFPVKAHLFRILFSNYFELRKFDEIEQLRQFIPAIETFPEILFNEALVADVQNRLKKAEDKYLHFLEFVLQDKYREDIGKDTFVLSGTISAAFSNLGKILLRQEKFEEALEHFNAAIDIMPSGVDLYAQASKILLRMNRTQEAKQRLLQAIDILEKQSYRLEQKKLIPQYKQLITKIDQVLS